MGHYPFLSSYILSGGNNTYVDTYVTGFTYDDANTITLSQSNGQSSGVTLNAFTGLTINGDLNVTGKTITGQLQVTGGTILSGSVLTSDSSGNATWQPPASTPYKVYTSYYNVEEGIEVVYQNTIGSLEYLNFYANYPNLILSGSTGVFGNVDNGTPFKTYVTVTNANNSDFIFYTNVVADSITGSGPSSKIYITSNPPDMVAGSAKFYIEVRIYN